MGDELSSSMPVIFAAHGAPILLDDAAWMGELAWWAQTMPRPRSILMFSAHWEQRPTTLGATRTVPLVFDFYGLPQRSSADERAVRHAMVASTLGSNTLSLARAWLTLA